ncbi:MAG TPA: hypothetical protein VNO33_12845 [Kofleriaceae bacterium]|nr:hypothetical protein [Kofleriaceae bacterium]
MTRTIIAATLALGLLGCGKGEGEKKNEPAPTAQPTAPAETPPAETPPTEPPAAGGDAGAADPAGEGSAEVAPEAAGASEVPTAEDFEEKASKDVNAKNLEAEVTEMEKELGAKPPAK